jgi:6-methylsalicylate decarboxylase
MTDSSSGRQTNASTNTQALKKAGGDPSGSWTPQWNLDADNEFSQALDIGVTIFSMTSPGPAIAGEAGSIPLARAANEYIASVRDKYPSKYGFFAAMPSLTNATAALAEIEYAFDSLGADGVILMTRYGSTNMYLGHPDFEPVWKALDDRHAVVLVHPTHAVDTKLVAANIPQPIVDYPHETTRAAVDLIMSNRLQACKNVKIILAHAGGTLPYLAKRAAVLNDVGLTAKTTEEILDDVGSFYFDVALSSSKETTHMLLQYTKPDHILYGSDYPYAPRKTVERFAQELDQAGLDPEVAASINRGNALKLFPRFNKK